MNDVQATGWREVTVGASVALQHPTLPPISGIIDAVAEDGTMFWVTAAPQERRLIHNSDDYTFT